jgi:Putative lumazine-binding
VARAYYDGMISGDEAKLALAFHPRASIVGNEGGAFTWSTLEEFAAECGEAAADPGPYEWRIEDLSFAGDTALVRLGGWFAGVWYTDDLSMVRIDGDWRIVHKTFYQHPPT